MNINFTDQTLYVLTTARAGEAATKKEVICFEIIREEQETQRKGFQSIFVRFSYININLNKYHTSKYYFFSSGLLIEQFRGKLRQFEKI